MDSLNAYNTAMLADEVQGMTDPDLAEAEGRSRLILAAVDVGYSHPDDVAWANAVTAEAARRRTYRENQLRTSGGELATCDHDPAFLVCSRCCDCAECVAIREAEAGR